MQESNQASARDAVSLRDSIHLVRDHASGVEAIRARFAGHAYDMHRHDDWLVGVTDHGIQDFFCRGVRRRSTPGRVILIEPEEAHDGEAGADNGFAYRMLYLPRTWLRGGLERTWDDDIGFRTTLTDDVRLAAAIRAAWMALSYAVPQLTRDAVLDAVIGALRPHLGRPTRRLPASHDPPVARRARETLHAAPEANIGLSELARSAGATDRFQLARAFRASYGTTPHAYLVQLRLVRAREHLARGMPPADVAAACGFADQSHLGRWFRRAYGLTPAAYRACCTNVRDTSAAFT